MIFKQKKMKAKSIGYSYIYTFKYVFITMKANIWLILIYILPSDIIANS